MGSWNLEALQNDTALDLMSWVSGMDSSNLNVFIRTLLHSHYEEEVILGAALVDTAVNGKDIKVYGNFYEYESWLDFFEKNHDKKIDSLKYEASVEVFRVIDTCLEKWFWTNKEKRKEYLEYLQEKLERKEEIQF